MSKIFTNELQKFMLFILRDVIWSLVFVLISTYSQHVALMERLLDYAILLSAVLLICECIALLISLKFCYFESK